MGAKAAVGILHKRKLAAAAPEEREALHEQPGRRARADRGRRRPRQSRSVSSTRRSTPRTPAASSTQALAEAPARRGRHKNIPL